MTALLMRRKAAARYLGISVGKFDGFVNAGRIPVVSDPDTGSRWYSKPALDRWLEANCPQGGAA